MNTPNTTDPTKPDYVRAEVAAIAPDLELIADLIEGTRAMQAHASDRQYIPQWPDEKIETYRKRILSAPVYEGLSRTLSASVGKIFAKPPKLEFKTREADLRAHWDNIDAAGTKGDVAAKEFVEGAIADGYALILVDHPPPLEGAVVTRENEAALGRRPVWSFFDRGAVLSWRTAVVNNVTILVQVVLAECDEEATGAFGTATVRYFRQLYVEGGVAKWRRWREPAEGSQEFTLDGEGTFVDRKGRTRDTLPLAIGYGGKKKADLVAKPPLLGVAHANLAHWRDSTELRWGSRISAIEQLVVKGKLMPRKVGNTTVDGELKIGWEHGINIEKEGEVAWVGPSGKGLDQLEKRMRESEEQIGAMGLAFLTRDTRAAETAEAKRLDASAEDSTLATAAQGNEDALNLAAEIHCWYLGIDKAQAFTVTLNRDFESTTLTPQQVMAIAKLVEHGLPKVEAVRMLIVGGTIKAAESEIERIAEAWESAMIDKERREADAEADLIARQRERQQREAA